MNCDGARLLIPEGAAGRLDENEAKDLDEHLAACEACRVEAGRLRAAAALAVAAFERNAPRVPEGLAARVVDRVAAERASGRRRRKSSARLAVVRRRPSRAVFWSALAAAAAALLVVGRALVPGAEAPAPKSVEAPERRGGSARDVAAVEQVESVDAPAPVVEESPERVSVAAADAEPVAPALEEAVEVPADVAVARPKTVPAAVPAPSRVDHLCYLDAAEGQIEFARGDEWSQAAQGMAFVPGDRVRTKFSRARVAFESGSVLYVNRFTTLTVGKKGAPGVELLGGEVYVEVAEGDVGLWVETSRGRVVDLGTRFGVKDSAGGTVVVVVEGAVEASTDEGSRKLEEGQEVLLVRRASLPGAVRRARNVGQRFAWATGGTLAAGGRPRGRYAAVIQPALPDAAYSVRNVVHVLKLVDAACGRGARLVVLPACTVYGDVSVAARGDAPVDETSDMVRAFAVRAKRHKAYIATGFYLRDEKGAVRHTAVLFGPDGRIVARQSKNHLANKEISGDVKQGFGFVVAETDLGSVGMLISKDVYSGRREWGETFTKRRVGLVLVLNSDADAKRYTDVLGPYATSHDATVLMANHVYGRTQGLSSALMPDGSARATGAGEGIVMVRLTHAKGAGGR